MADETTSPTIAASKREGVFNELKIDFPALLALNIFITFAAVTLLSLFITIPIDGPTGQLLEVLKNVVLIMVGFYFGSAISNRRKDEAIIGQMAPAKNPPNLPEPAPPAPVIAWWSLLTDSEKAAINAARTDARVQTFADKAQAGRADGADLDYLVSRGLLTAPRASTIKAS